MAFAAAFWMGTRVYAGWVKPGVTLSAHSRGGCFAGNARLGDMCRRVQKSRGLQKDVGKRLIGLCRRALGAFLGESR